MANKEESKQTASGLDVNLAALPLMVAPVLRGYEQLVREQQQDLADRRQWRWVVRGVLTLLLGGALAVAFRIAGVSLWASDQDAGSTVAVLPVIGTIGDEVTADRLVPMIVSACESPAVGALILNIRSEGGSPSHAHRIARAVERCRARTGKPVTAVIQGMGASGAYLIAVSADRVVADDYAFVGSMGAYITALDVSEAAQRAGIQQRLFASGPHKGMLSPWRSTDAPQAEVAQTLANDVAAVFRAYVETRRQGKLSKTDDMFTGRVWVGAQAKRLGLIDDVAVIEEVIEEEFTGMTPTYYELPRSWRDVASMASFTDALTASFVRVGQRIEVH